MLRFTRPSLYSNHTDYVQPILAKIDRRTHHSDGDFTDSSGSGGNSHQAHGLSVGAIVGIAVGSLIALVLVIGLLYWWKPKFSKAGASSRGKTKSQAGDPVGRVVTQGNGTNTPQSPLEVSYHPMADGPQANPQSMENHIRVMKIMNWRVMIVFDQRWRLTGIVPIP